MFQLLVGRIVDPRVLSPGTGRDLVHLPWVGVSLGTALELLGAAGEDLQVAGPEVEARAGEQAEHGWVVLRVDEGAQGGVDVRYLRDVQQPRPAGELHGHALCAQELEDR